MGEIAANLALTSADNFIAEEYEELSNFIIETSYQNENYIQLDTMQQVEIQREAQKLYDQAVSFLERISQPRYEFSVDSANFLFLQEFQAFSNQIKLGCEIHVELSDGVVYSPVLLQVSLNYDDPTAFSMTFGNRKRLDSPDFIFADLFSNAVAASSTVSLSSAGWNNFNTNYKSKVATFMESALDASKNAVISSDNQEFTIDRVGLRGREILDGVVQDEQIWINNGTIAFTKNGWNSAALALGKITVGGNSTYGLVADAIVGKLLVGENLTIANSNNSFTVDESGAFLDNATFLMSASQVGGGKILMDPRYGIAAGTSNLYTLDNGQVTQNFLLNGVWNPDGPANFYLDLRSGDAYFKGTVHATDGLFTGTVHATSGEFNGVVKATDFQTSGGISMLTNEGKWKSDYLSLYGIEILNDDDDVTFAVNGTTGAVTISGGSISWDSVDSAGIDAQVANANSRANTALSDVERLANGEYLSGTFINEDSIFSPNISGGTITGGTIIGGKIKGAEFSDINRNGMLKLSSGTNYADLTYTNVNSDIEVFKIEDMGGYVNLYLFGNILFTAREGGFTSYATAKFA